MSRPVQLLVLPVRCPTCGAPARMRITPVVRKLLDAGSRAVDIHPDTVVTTYQCARRNPDGSLCNSFMYVKARHWTEARPE